MDTAFFQLLGVHGAFRDTLDAATTSARVALDGGAENLLVDCGPTTVAMLLRAGVSLSQVTCALVTHVHGDHVAGLEELAFRLYYQSKARLTVVAPATVWEELYPYLDAVLTPFRHRVSGKQRFLLTDIISAVELAKDGEVLAGVMVQPFDVPHCPAKPSVGYSFSLDGRQMVWSGDTVFRPELFTQFPEARMFFHDCSFTPKFPNTVHAHREELMELPEEFRKKRVTLIHHGRPGTRDDEFYRVGVPFDIFHF